MFETSDELLEHFGAKGMKWGVRRERRKNRTPTEKKMDRRKAIASSTAGLGVFFLARRGLLTIPFSALVGASTTLAVNALIEKSRDKKISELN